MRTRSLFVDAPLLVIGIAVLIAIQIERLTYAFATFLVFLVAALVSKNSGYGGSPFFFNLNGWPIEPIPVIAAVLSIAIVALLIYLIVKPASRLSACIGAFVGTEPTRECPYCFSSIVQEATRCPFCTSQIAPPTAAEGS